MRREDILIEIEFEVPGRPCPNHRPRARVQRLKGGRVCAQIYNAPEYNNYLAVVNQFAASAAFKTSWIPPAQIQKRKFILFIRAFWSTWEKGLRKTGPNAGLLVKIGHPTPDGDNIVKPIKDGCQGPLYHNDNLVTALPWPGYLDFIEKVDDPDLQKVRVGLAYMP